MGEYQEPFNERLEITVVVLMGTEFSARSFFSGFNKDIIRASMLLQER